MKARIEYRLENISHPWNEERRKQGMKAWCLMCRTIPELGPSTEEPVAIFNMDSDAERFAGHVFAEGLDGKLVSVGSDFRGLFQLTLRNR